MRRRSEYRAPGNPGSPTENAAAPSGNPGSRGAIAEPAVARFPGPEDFEETVSALTGHVPAGVHIVPPGVTIHVSEQATAGQVSAAARIQEASIPLAEELRKPRPLVVSAHGDLSPDFAGVVETVFQVDVGAEYPRLERELHLDERAERQSIRDQLNVSARNASMAHRLYVASKVELEKWELDQAESLGAIRAHALEALEEEKDQGTRKKAITNADVEAKMLADHPDEVRHQTMRRARIKGTVEHMQRLADLWVQRCRDLSTMLATSRGA